MRVLACSATCSPLKCPTLQMQRTCTVMVPDLIGKNLAAAEKVAAAARRFKSDVMLNSSAFETDAKSLFGILVLSAAAGMQVSITADGPDAVPAVSALSELFQEDIEREINKVDGIDSARADTEKAAWESTR
jgi:phosphotransferase system HPr (HPr) family protein